jgi:hypothetical protein
MKRCLSIEERQWLGTTHNPYATLALDDDEDTTTLQTQALQDNEASDYLNDADERTSSAATSTI